MITDNLTNAVYFSDLLPKKCPTLNQHIAQVLEANGIPFAYLIETKDIWCRDFMPIQTAEDGFVSYVISTDTQHQKYYLTLNCGEKPRVTNPTKLSQILEQADTRYNLSPKACAGILRRAERRGKELPKELKTALEQQAKSSE